MSPSQFDMASQLDCRIFPLRRRTSTSEVGQRYWVIRSGAVPALPKGGTMKLRSRQAVQASQEHHFFNLIKFFFPLKASISCLKIIFTRWKHIQFLHFLLQINGEQNLIFYFHYRIIMEILRKLFSPLNMVPQCFCIFLRCTIENKTTKHMLKTKRLKSHRIHWHGKATFCSLFISWPDDISVFHKKLLYLLQSYHRLSLYGGVLTPVEMLVAHVGQLSVITAQVCWCSGVTFKALQCHQLLSLTGHPVRSELPTRTPINRQLH